MADAKGRKIFDGRYEILAIVGRGACSVVYHARHAMTPSSEVALKVLLNKSAGQQILADKLRKEALALVSSRHRYVVRLDDFHTVGELSYLSMEYAPHSDLRKYAQTLGSTLPPDIGELFLIQSSEALSFVHKAGLVHRDLKPDNILVVNPRECRLADFGVAVLPGEESSLEELRLGVGTFDYMAPEVLQGTGYDRRSDVYALGVTFYELLSGRHPFAGLPLAQQIEARQDGAVKPLSELAPEVPTHLATSIMQAMRFDPRDRFPSGKEFNQTILIGRAQRKLTPVVGGAPPVAPPTAAPPEAQSVPRAEATAERLVANAPPPPSQPPSAPTATTSATAPRAETMGTPVTPEGPTPPRAAPEAMAASDLVARRSVSRNERTTTERGAVTERQPQGPPVEKRSSGKATVTPQKPGIFGALAHKDPRKSALLTASIVVFFIILAYGNVFIKRTFDIDIAQQLIDYSIGGSGPVSSFIPEYTGQTLSFPALPPGSYAGTMTGLVPGRTVPLTMLSFAEQGFLVVIPGVEGMTPATVSLAELPSDAAAIRVATSGFIIEMSGQPIDDEVVGYFKNMLTGEEGEWRARPIRR